MREVFLCKVLDHVLENDALLDVLHLLVRVRILVLLHELHELMPAICDLFQIHLHVTRRQIDNGLLCPHQKANEVLAIFPIYLDGD